MNTKTENFNRKDHWEQVYSDREATQVSWFQQRPENSLALIEATGVEKSARIIDIGGGASTLVDYLLATGYQNLTVLDIAHSAIEQARNRLGEHADKIKWIEQDITRFVSDEPFDVWHDRAVFHFLTDADDRSSYVEALSDALEPGAHAIIATFNLAGPEKCSGLDIVQYSPESLAAIFSENFQLVESSTEQHKTPRGTLQNFVYCRFKRV